jgi:hypothetical protein
MGSLDLQITYCSEFPHTLYYTHHLDGIVGYLSDVQCRGSTCTSVTCINYLRFCASGSLSIIIRDSREQLRFLSMQSR